MNMHQIAIVMVFWWACIYACSCYLFKRKANRLKTKIKRTSTSCQDYTAILVSTSLLEDRNKIKVWENLGILETMILFTSTFVISISLALALFSLLVILGYAIFIFAAGLIVFLDKEGDDAYWYSGKIVKEPLEKLQKKDVTVMAYMLDVLRSRQSRYKTLTVILFVFTVAGFILLKITGAG